MLENGETDMRHILTTISTNKFPHSEKQERLHLDDTNVEAIIKSMDFEYDQQVAQSLLAANHTRSEICKLGMKPDRAVKGLTKVLDAVNRPPVAKYKMWR